MEDLHPTTTPPPDALTSGLAVVLLYGTKTNVPVETSAIPLCAQCEVCCSRDGEESPQPPPFLPLLLLLLPAGFSPL
ncbi:hypothetical protein INR49_028666 [Caranx melampygus]|nr:hypothetical protein INR49_028666 [Caranx melampygus]